MNFLAHYYCLTEKENQYKILGCLLPDIIPYFSKLYNQKIRHESLTDLEQFLLEIEKGILLHIEMDEIFHGLEVFKQMCSDVKQLIQAENIDTERKEFVIAHVLVELLLDRLLIEEKKVFIADFYAKIGKVDSVILDNYVKKRALVEDSQSIIRKFKSFLDGKYALALESDEGIAFALQQILGNRIGQHIFADKEKWQIIVKNAFATQKDKMMLLVDGVNKELTK
ncbi:MAG: hypothetical protein ACPG4Z_04220 [Chitinophagales bacterium]